MPIGTIHNTTAAYQILRPKIACDGWALQPKSHSSRPHWCDPPKWSPRSDFLHPCQFAYDVILVQQSMNAFHMGMVNVSICSLFPDNHLANAQNDRFHSNNCNFMHSHNESIVEFLLYFFLILCWDWTENRSCTIWIVARSLSTLLIS